MKFHQICPFPVMFQVHCWIHQSCHDVRSAVRMCWAGRVTERTNCRCEKNALAQGILQNYIWSKPQKLTLSDLAAWHCPETITDWLVAFNMFPSFPCDAFQMSNHMSNHTFQMAQQTTNQLRLSLLCLVLAPTFFSALRTLHRRQAPVSSSSKAGGQWLMRGSQRCLGALLYGCSLLWRARLGSQKKMTIKLPGEEDNGESP